MKIRTGFVSNSSSSSFVIQKKYISEYQLEKLHEHKIEAERNSWCIYNDGDTIRGSTLMDNFDIEGYMKKIGIDTSKVDWY